MINLISVLEQHSYYRVSRFCRQFVKHKQCIGAKKIENALLVGLHKAEFERAGLELRPSESANIDGEIQPL
jgi:hypothetical protein